MANIRFSVVFLTVLTVFAEEGASIASSAYSDAFAESAQLPAVYALLDMAKPASGSYLANIKAALLNLVDGLDPNQMLGIGTYSGDDQTPYVQEIMPLLVIGDHKDVWNNAINGLQLSSTVSTRDVGAALRDVIPKLKPYVDVGSVIFLSGVYSPNEGTNSEMDSLKLLLDNNIRLATLQVTYTVRTAFLQRITLSSGGNYFIGLSTAASAFTNASNAVIQLASSPLPIYKKALAKEVDLNDADSMSFELANPGPTSVVFQSSVVNNITLTVTSPGGVPYSLNTKTCNWNLGIAPIYQCTLGVWALEIDDAEAGAWSYSIKCNTCDDKELSGNMDLFVTPGLVPVTSTSSAPTVPTTEPTTILTTEPTTIPTTPTTESTVILTTEPTTIPTTELTTTPTTESTVTSTTESTTIPTTESTVTSTTESTTIPTTESTVTSTTESTTIPTTESTTIPTTELTTIPTTELTTTPTTESTVTSTTESTTIPTTESTVTSTTESTTIPTTESTTIPTTELTTTPTTESTVTSTTESATIPTTESTVTSTTESTTIPTTESTTIPTTELTTTPTTESTVISTTEPTTIPTISSSTEETTTVTEPTTKPTITWSTTEGSSDFSGSTDVTTTVKPPFTKSAAFIGGVTGGCILLVILVVLIVVCWNKRSNAGYTDMETAPALGASSDERPQTSWKNQTAAFQPYHPSRYDPNVRPTELTVPSKAGYWNETYENDDITLTAL